MKKINSHGGSRKNSGRKKSGIKTKIISFRIPVEFEDKIKTEIRNLIIKLIGKK